MIFSGLLLIFISIIIIILASILSKKSFCDREKNSPFECGFDPSRSSRLPFSLRFFLISIIFLIFDVEIVLLFPVIPLINYSSLLVWDFSVSFFVLILLLGLFHEWNQGALEWSE